MKSPLVVDALMEAIPASCRTRWCGGEKGPCACLGCVQVANRAVIAEKIRGEPYRGDPEHLSEAKLQTHGQLYTDNKVTREEWEAWRLRQCSGDVNSENPVTPS